MPAQSQRDHRVDLWQEQSPLSNQMGRPAGNPKSGSRRLAQRFARKASLGFSASLRRARQSSVPGRSAAEAPQVQMTEFGGNSYSMGGLLLGDHCGSERRR